MKRLNEAKLNNEENYKRRNDWNTRKQNWFRSEGTVMGTLNEWKEVSIYIKKTEKIEKRDKKKKDNYRKKGKRK